MKTCDTDRAPYGSINLALARSLYRANSFSKAMLHLYIGARRNLKDGKWEFNVPDMAAQTGVDRRVLARHVKKLQSEGVFVSAGSTSRGARKFTLNQKIYETLYANFRAEECAPDACPSNEHPDVHPVQHQHASNEHPDVHSMQGVCASDEHHDVHPMDTKNKEKEEGEAKRQTDRQEEANACLPVCLSSSRPPLKENQKGFHPFIRPVYVQDSNRTDLRQEQENHENKRRDIKNESSEESSSSDASSVTSLSVISDSVPVKPVSSGTQAVGALPPEFTETTPYNYTIGDVTHEIYFAAQEEDPALSPDEKVSVLKRSLIPFTTMGNTELPRGAVLSINQTSFAMVRTFFELNPTIPISSLLKVLWECNRVTYENPVKDNGFKPCFTHRAAAESLTYLIKNFEMINGLMPEDVRLPDNVQFLTETPATTR